MFDIIFAIETSCDETSAAILKGPEVLSNIVSSQLFHNEFGGIVPELASRAHIRSIDRIVCKAFNKAKIKPEDVTIIAATAGPGLIGSILTGYNFAKAFSVVRNIPFIGIDHIESHIFSCFIGKAEIDFPFISLVVSGGHTILFLVENYDKYIVLGETADDAAGEVFDKVAKMLGLNYPGGPEIDRLAESGNEHYHTFPEAALKNNIYGFSFSGVKTSVLYHLKKNFKETKEMPVNDICASFRRAVISSLVSKTIKAAKDFGVKKIAVSGGVSANSKLKTEFRKLEKDGFETFFPEKNFSTDNAAMIGYNAYLKSVYCNIDYKSHLYLNAYPAFKS